jgi:DNA modification methylase
MPTQRIHLGDCVAALNRRAPGWAALLAADPPYNIGQGYDSYLDRKTRGEYLAWCSAWMGAAARALDAAGSLWVFCPDQWVSRLDCMAQDAFGFRKVNHVVWAFTFGQAQRRKFTPSHLHLLWLARGEEYRFHPEAVAVPSAREAVYADPRAKAGGKMPDATWLLHRAEIAAALGPDLDVWLESRVAGTFRERRAHSPNQLPVPLLERVVRACSGPGDRCGDLFAGTGSMGVACRRLGRAFDGWDVSPAAVAAGNERIAAAEPAR